MSSLYESLKTKEIYAILDGDTNFGQVQFEDGRFVKISMPYLTGADLCGIFITFGFPSTSYSKGSAALSRWQYVECLLDCCLKENRVPDLLAYFFEKTRFSKHLSGCSAEEVNSIYEQIKGTVIKKINGILTFSGNELIVRNNQFVIQKIGSNVEIQTPMLKNIDREYIKSICNRAMQDVEQQNFDSAITKARTLLEEIFCYVIEKKNGSPTDSGDIAKMFKQVKDLYNMHTDPSVDRRINTLLSGLNSIVSAIAEMRNKDSDAHGVGAARISVEEHHARLLVNSAMAMADFILSVETKINSMENVK